MSMATRDNLEDLHRLLVGELATKYRKGSKRPSVELLQVTRKVLRDNGQIMAQDEATTRQLQQLHRDYSRALSAALSGPVVSAGLLQEARFWLIHHGIRADLPTVQAAAITKKMGELDLPFTKH